MLITTTDKTDQHTGTILVSQIDIIDSRRLTSPVIPSAQDFVAENIGYCCETEDREEYQVGPPLLDYVGSITCKDGRSRYELCSKKTFCRDKCDPASNICPADPEALTKSQLVYL